VLQLTRVLFALVLVAVGTLLDGVPFGDSGFGAANAAPAPPVPAPVLASEKQFLVAHQEADPRFITSIERVGACKVTTPPFTEGIRFPWQLYPKESVDRHEEGTVQMELILDPDWCVRKATIIQSTGYWRLDGVSLTYMMTVKFMPKPETIKQKDGEPTVVIRLGWGESQRKKR
jgi:outer membrane biosynthesis protein TonB